MNQIQESPLSESVPHIKICKCGTEIHPKYIPVIKSWYISEECVKCKQIQKEIQEREAKELEEEKLWITLLKNTGIPRRHALKSLNEFEYESVVHEKYIEDYINHFRDYFEVGKGLLIIGITGTGKTHLAVGLCMELYMRYGINLKYINYVEFLEELKISYSNNSENNLEKYKRADFLVIDDLGAEAPKEWSSEKLYYLVNYRYNAMLPTIVTCNLTAKELRDKVGDRTYGRLCEISTGIIFKGSDRRLTRGN